MKKLLLINFFVGFTAVLSFGQAFNMTLEGTWDNTSYNFNDCWGYTDVLGNEYAIVGSRATVIFFDITTPTVPVLLAEFTGAYPGINGATSTWRDFKTYDKFAYAVADVGSEGLMVFDMSDIHNGNIVKVNQFNTDFIRGHNLFIDVPEGKLYVLGPNTTGATGGQNNDVVVYDIKEDPSNPVHLASVNVSGGYIHDAYVKDNILYASSGNDGLYIIDMAVPTAPVFKSFNTSTTAGFNHSGWPFDNGDKMIVAEEVPQGLKLGIFDVSDLNNISFISDFRDPILTGVTGNVTYHNPYMVGDYAVISSYQDGITIMDLSNTNTPFRAAHYDTHVNSSYSGYQGNWGAYPYFPSGTIIGSDITRGLFVLSTSLNLTNTCANGVQDDFEIDVDCGGFCNTCACSAPDDMTFSSPNATTVELDWTAVSTAVGYEVRYRIGSANWTNATTGTNSITLNNLSPSTTYEFQIRADCGNRNTPYATIQAFTTNNCIDNATFTGSQSTGDYITRDYIISSVSTKPNSDINYISGDSIVLLPDFTVDANTLFHAQVNAPCGAFPLVAPSSNLQYAQLHTAEPEANFSLIENDGAGVFYIVANRNEDERKPYSVNVLDDNGNTISSNTELHTRSIVKFKSNKIQKMVHVIEGDEVHKFILQY